MENINEFAGNWAVILGGSSGLGLASARKLASHGMNICIIHRDRMINLPDFQESILNMKLEGVEVLTYNKDALTQETMTEVIDNLPIGSVKLLLHSIAKGSVKPMYANNQSILSKEDLDITLYAMGTSWYIWTQALIKKGLFTLNGRNIAFTSEGNIKVWQGYGAISVAKATLEALMRQMAVEFAQLGITSNCIQAGATKTPSFDLIPESDKLADLTKHRNPFKRMTLPEDVANVVYLLCKKEADWINGSILNVDGGESIR